MKVPQRGNHQRQESKQRPYRCLPAFQFLIEGEGIPRALYTLSVKPDSIR